MSAGQRIALLTALSFVSLGAAAVVQHPAPEGALDEVFDQVPFDKWTAAGEHTQLPWKPRVTPARLGIHQRLRSHVEIELDGAELARRRGKGELVLFVQFKDAKGARYQAHNTIDLNKLEEGVKNNTLTNLWSVFVLPGEYRVALAALVTGTEERNFTEMDLRVAPLKNDPLPDAWRDLSPVQILPAAAPPDGWYLPFVTERLNLPVKTRRPLKVEMIVNLTPSERASGSQRMTNRNLGVLIPALKTLTQADAPTAALNLTALDLSRRRVSFHQEDLHELDWSGLRDALTEDQPGTIDIKSLGERRNNAAFFVSEVGRRLGDARALIVLSGPVSFESGEDLRPIGVPASPGCRVFYIRYHPAPFAALQPLGPFGPYPGPGGRMSRRPGWNGPVRSVHEVQFDQLEPTLKPLSPRLFDVETPEQYRKALATIFAEIAEL